MNYNNVKDDIYEGSNMIVKYNREKLNSAIKHFCVIANVSVAVLDADFVSLAYYSEKNPEFCKEIQKTDCGRKKCRCSDMALLQKCKESGNLETHICHAGILDGAMPIIKAGSTIGYILIGRTRIDEFDEEKISWMNTDMDAMRKKYHNITEYDSKQIQSMFELASMIVSFILTNDIITHKVDEFASKADKFIECNLKNKITVDILCREFNVSKNFLYDSFKNSFGLTVNEYIMSKRLQTGRELLKTTDYSVSRIADEIGIGTYTYFGKLFKRKYGLSPLSFRKINREETTVNKTSQQTML